MTPEAQEGLQRLINTRLKYGLLRCCSSPPVLPAMKTTGEYRLVQDLRITEGPVHTLPACSSKPIYNSRGATPRNRMVLRSKGCLLLYTPQPLLLSFKHQQQVPCTGFPQGFQDRPHLCGQALAKGPSQPVPSAGDAHSVCA